MIPAMHTTDWGAELRTFLAAVLADDGPRSEYHANELDRRFSRWAAGRSETPPGGRAFHRLMRLHAPEWAMIERRSGGLFFLVPRRPTPTTMAAVPRPHPPTPPSVGGCSNSSPWPRIRPCWPRIPPPGHGLNLA